MVFLLLGGSGRSICQQKATQIFELANRQFLVFDWQIGLGLSIHYERQSIENHVYEPPLIRLWVTKCGDEPARCLAGFRVRQWSMWESQFMVALITCVGHQLQHDSAPTADPCWRQVAEQSCNKYILKWSIEDHHHCDLRHPVPIGKAMRFSLSTSLANHQLEHPSWRLWEPSKRGYQIWEPDREQLGSSLYCRMLRGHRWHNRA